MGGLKKATETFNVQDNNKIEAAEIYSDKSVLLDYSKPGTFFHFSFLCVGLCMSDVVGGDF